jgi:hypothetical protein
MTSDDARKMDILLEFKKEYNLLDTTDPAVLGMPLGKGYSLLASVKAPWVIRFNDGVEITTYPVSSPSVPYTNAKDPLTLAKKFETACKEAGIEFSPFNCPEKKTGREKEEVKEAIQNKIKELEEETARREKEENIEQPKVMDDISLIKILDCLLTGKKVMA